MLITITLLAFLVLLLVSLASLTRVETQVASNGQQLAAARQNALMALNIALGQLQQTAGPDQRVSARADILDTNPATPAADGVKQPLWTGVWMTNNPAAGANNQLDAGANPTLRSWSATNPTGNNSRVAWLVSGAKTPIVNATTDTPVDNTSINPSSWTATSTNSVELAKNLGAGKDITVSAPLVSIKSDVAGFSGPQPIGNFAYWVSDEGVKARFNLPDATYGSNDLPLTQLHTVVPQSNAMSQVVPLTSTSSDFRGNLASDVKKVLTLNALPFVSGVDGTVPVSRYSPDVTSYSQGVVADVRNGGLKTDLTSVFESPTLFASTFGTSMVYVNAVSTWAGLPWSALYFHYNNYKAVMPSPVTPASGKVTPTGVGDPSNLPYSVSTRAYSYSANGSNSVIGTLHPIPIAIRVDVALESFDGGTQGWLLRLRYYPQLVLYNPYAVRLKASGFIYSRAFSAWSTGVARAMLKGLTVGTNKYGDIQINDLSSVARLNIQNAAGEADVMDPGETRVFALGADTSKPSLAEAISFNDLISHSNSPKSSSDFSQYATIPPPSGATPNAASDTVNFTLANANSNINAVDTQIFSNNLVWPSSWSGRILNATGLAGSLPAPGGSWSPLTLSQLSGSPRRIVGLYVRTKGLNNVASTYTYSRASELAPLLMGNCPTYNFFSDSLSYQWSEAYRGSVGGIYQNGQTDVQISPTSGNTWQTSWGDASTGVRPAGNRYVLRDVPSQPMVSLGQFMHLSAGIYPGGSANMEFGSMFVGGSYASPIMKTDVSEFISGSRPPIFFDDSFKANETLFDRYFFSTVPPPPASLLPPTNYPAQWTAFNNANSSTRVTDPSKPFLNQRLRPYNTSAGAPLLADLRDSKKAAANLTLEGAFNVNSTSVDAWRALLGGLSGNDLKIWSATTESLVTVSTNNAYPIPRFWSASATGSANQPWDGLRLLDNNELTQLATRIVEQVKLRGPFLSMGDFLNRRLGATGPLTLSGALQAAIDSTNPDINLAAKAKGTSMKVTTGSPAIVNTVDSSNNTLSTATGMPGYLMQQDIVQNFSAAMSARSDTFVVRTYGETVNPATGTTSAKAWAEAVVQRIPEYINSSADSPDVYPPINSDNLRFGRRFKVVAFRWLTPNDL